MSNAAQSKSGVKFTLILLAVSLFTAIVIYFGIVHEQNKKHHTENVKIEGAFLPEAKEINDFNLTANNGAPFTKENMKGKWTMMLFGFTNCGYVCPTTLGELNKMVKVLKKELPEDQIPQIVLVSVDPERDTVKRMNEYMAKFNENFIGARAELAETEALENNLHISAIKLQGDDTEKDQYMVNHSAEIILFNPEAKIQAYFSFPHKADQLAKDYRSILGAIS